MRKSKKLKEILTRKMNIGDLVIVSFDEKCYEPFIFGIVIGYNEYYIRYHDEKQYYEKVCLNNIVYLIENPDKEESKIQKDLQQYYMKYSMSEIKGEEFQ